MRLSKSKIWKIERVGKEEKISTSTLLEKCGYIKQVQSGLFVQMNLMKRVINNIENIIRNEFENAGIIEIGLNQLQSADIWRQTGRYDTYGSEMFKMKDRIDKEMVITGTNEELVTLIAKDYVRSYRDLNFTFYQINNKFRDEIRCNTGLIRSKEFLMMDAYSFHTSKSELEVQYETMKQCYINIFNTLGIKFEIVSASSGEIGGSVSEEFVVKTSDGEIEIGHIFQLDTKYSSAMGAKYVGQDNLKHDIVMGCYGIGISRLAQVLADVGRIGNCFNWNENISAYKYGVIIADVNDIDQVNAAESIYEDFIKKGISAYIDDRDIRIGEKLNESDTIGTANKILIGKNIHEGYYEEKKLSSDKWSKVELKFETIK